MNPSAARTRQIALALGAAMILLALGVTLSTTRDDGASTLMAGGGTQTVAVTLADMRVSPAHLTVASGTRLVLEVTNADRMQHDLRFEDGTATPLLASGASARLDLGELTASTVGWCTLPGHRAAGMTMTITVLDASAHGAHGGHSGSGAAADGPAGDADAARFDRSATPGAGWSARDPELPPAPSARVHRLTLRATDEITEVVPGVRQTIWTFGGTAPGPTLRGRVGDRFVITFVNDASTGHGIDFHAGSLAPDGPMRTIQPGESLTYRFTATHSGAWLYHCSTAPMSLHIANGMFGAVIIDPPNLAEVDRELVLVQSEIYLGAPEGTASETKLAEERPDAVVFNGYADQYVHEPVAVRADERLRIWVVVAGPQRGTAFHVVGGQFDTVFKEGAYLLRPGNAEQGAAQVLDLAPAQGGFVELVLPEPGNYPFVDHAMVDGERGAHGMLRAR